MHVQAQLIEEFLSSRRIAVVGVSRNPRDFTRQLWNEFRPLGAVPVHPSQSEIDGVACFPDLRSITPPATAALLLVGEAHTRAVLEECLATGIDLVWIYGVTGPKSVPREILTWCDGRGMRVIAGYCPFMFLPGMAWPHRLHGAVGRFLGHRPG